MHLRAFRLYLNYIPSPDEPPPRSIGDDEMAIVEINIIPLGTSNPSIGDSVAAAVKALQDKGYNCELTPFGTVLDGTVEEAMEAAKTAHEAAFAGGLQRVMTIIKIDDRRDKKATAASKLEGLRARLG